MCGTWYRYLRVPKHNIVINNYREVQEKLRCTNAVDRCMLKFSRNYSTIRTINNFVSLIQVTSYNSVKLAKFDWLM